MDKIHGTIANAIQNFKIDKIMKYALKLLIISVIFFISFYQSFYSSEYIYHISERYYLVSCGIQFSLYANVLLLVLMGFRSIETRNALALITVQVLFFGHAVGAMIIIVTWPTYSPAHHAILYVLQKYYNIDGSLNILQDMFICCGVNSFEEYLDRNMTLPATCCEVAKRDCLLSPCKSHESCTEALITFFAIEKKVERMIFALYFLMMMVCGVCSTILLLNELTLYIKPKAKKPKKPKKKKKKKRKRSKKLKKLKKLLALRKKQKEKEEREKEKAEMEKQKELDREKDQEKDKEKDKRKAKKEKKKKKKKKKKGESDEEEKVEVVDKCNIRKKVEEPVITTVDDLDIFDEFEDEEDDSDQSDQSDQSDDESDQTEIVSIIHRAFDPEVQKEIEKQKEKEREKERERERERERQRRREEEGEYDEDDGPCCSIC